MKKLVKEYFVKRARVSLAGILLLTAVGLFIWGRYWTSQADILINLSAGALSSLATLFIVDLLLEAQKKQQWEGAAEVAAEELNGLANMLASYIGSPLGYSVSNHWAEISDDPIGKSGPLLDKFVDAMIADDTRQKFSSLSTDDWNVLHANIILLRTALGQYIDLYHAIIPPDTLGKILKINRDLNHFFTIFTLIPEYFTAPQKQWPANRRGLAGNKENRKGFMNNMASTLDACLPHIQSLRKIAKESSR